MANSVKGAGHCVAGIEILPDGSLGNWIRPIGSGHEDALTNREQAYPNGANPQLLDVVDMRLLGHEPQGCQTENWRVDPTYRWVKVNTATIAQASALAESPPILFLNAGRSGKGWNDQIANDVADAQVTRSLHLIHVGAVEIQVTHGYNGGAHEIRAEFLHQRELYRLKITDPAVRNAFLPMGIGSYDLGSCLLCISLAAPFLKGSDDIWYRYKVVAGIVRLP
ncbi:hypothetical protein [Burkholderia sp. BCC0397]|uniref:dual OB domain-containing protein n=1 Tax=Burkholderia sp. BCC0397 TaxID=486876 RepID=UPI001588684B|nr:hypothetical protein [Burkholderia sp. BCC0397]